MKDSGVEWIGEIPKKWNIVPAKAVFKNEKTIVGSLEKNFQRLALTLDGVIQREKFDSNGLQPANFETYQIVRKKDLIFKLIDLENIKTSRVGLSEYEGIVSPVYIRLVNERASEYGFWYFYDLWNQNVFNVLGSGVRSNLTSKDLLNLPFIENNNSMEIVRKIKKEVKVINNIVAKTKESIEELKKYKQSLITEVVTKGLDKNVEMKDSGIEWIGEIPKDWEVNKLKRLFGIRKRIVGNNDYQVLSVTQKGLKIKDTSVNAGQMSSDYSKYQLVEPADFVMNHMDLLTGWIDNSVYTGVTSPDYRVFSTINNSKSYNEYFLYTFQMLYKNKIFYGMGQGVSNLGRWRLQSTTFLNLYLPVPSIEEQKQIVKYLNSKMNNIDALIELKHNIIDEYESYKKSLIYEYVTGKKEVGEEVE